MVTAAWLSRDVEPSSRSPLRQLQPNIASFSAAVPLSEAGAPERLGIPATRYCATGSGRRTDQRSPPRRIRALQASAARPPLLRAVAKVGETLRYEGTLDAALREWTICVVARELSNAFRAGDHLPLAAAAGVPKAALATLETGEPSPGDLRRDLALARAVVHELVGQHRLSEETYSDAQQWGEPAVVELLVLVGYFAMICWLMNVARTPGPVT